MAKLYSTDNLGKRRLEKKKGMLRKEIIEMDLHIFEELPEDATLENEYTYKRHIADKMKDSDKDGVRIYSATDSTHTPEIEHGVGNLSPRILARDMEDAIKWNIFLQLLTHLPALSTPRKIFSRDLGKKNAGVLEKFLEEKVFAMDIEALTHKIKAIRRVSEDKIGGFLPRFEELKKNPELRKRFAREFRSAHWDSLTLKARDRIDEAVEKAITAAEIIAEMKIANMYFDDFGKKKFRPIFKSPDDIYKIPELVEFLKLVEEVIPRDMLKWPLSKPPAEVKKDFTGSEEETEEEWETSLEDEAKRLIGVVQGLKLINAGPEELGKVEEDLWRKIAETEDLSLAGLYVKLIAHLREKDLEGAEKFLSELEKD